MGVPAFYRWLSEKYPKIVVEVLENRNAVVDGIEVPVDLTQPNPNGIEYDNLYIDMNGLIHPCSHPEDREAPSSEAEMYINVTKYVDRLFAAVRPRKVLFMAIDGVAPRAKMNQQRSRRFRAAQDTKDRQKLMDEVIQEIEELGTMETSTAANGGDGWDSNVITPGTEFMYNLSLYLRYFILNRMNTNPAWKNIKVILSDANEPGEGEHKIMKFIRSERCQPGYNPNQHHILHGLDADLIMLALATHEPHFTILRELVTFGGHQQRDKPTNTVSQSQQLLDAQNSHLFQRPLTTATNSKSVVCANPEDEWIFSKPLQSLHISILREYLENEFSCFSTPTSYMTTISMNNNNNNNYLYQQQQQQQQPQVFLPFPYDFERVIDDFVFLCFFVGNDFLPHLPSLDIRDGALDFLIESYKEILPTLGDYITTPGGNVNLPQADVILGRVGEIEDLVFQRKKSAEDGLERRRAQYNTSNKSNNSNGASGGSSGGGGGGNGGNGGNKSQIVFQASSSHTRFSTEQQQQQQQQYPSPSILPVTVNNIQRIPYPPPQPPSSSVSAAPPRLLAPPLNNQEAAKSLREKVLGKRSINTTATSNNTTSNNTSNNNNNNNNNTSNNGMTSTTTNSTTLSSSTSSTASAIIGGGGVSVTESADSIEGVTDMSHNEDVATIATVEQDIENMNVSGPPYKKAHIMNDDDDDDEVSTNNNSINNNKTLFSSDNNTVQPASSTTANSGSNNHQDNHNDNAKAGAEIEIINQHNDDDDDDDKTTTATTAATGIVININEEKEEEDNADDDDDEEEEEEVKVVEPLIMTLLSSLPSSSSSSSLKTAIDPEELKRRLKAKESAKLDKNKETTQDHVRLHEAGWKARYYEDPPKKANLEEGGGLQRMCHTYVEGLCWVLKYYYEGCPSWNWYYPFHYAPFASDLVNIDRYDIQFEMSEPFRPIEQLLAVLPAESVHALPMACRWLMTEDKSPIKDLYISDIPIDPNGKHLPWLWILLLPFIEAKRISHAFESCKHLLTLDERRRNVFSGAYIFVHSQHFLAQKLIQKKDFQYRPEKEKNVEILEAMRKEMNKSSMNGNDKSNMKFEGDILCIDSNNSSNNSSGNDDDDDENIRFNDQNGHHSSNNDSSLVISTIDTIASSSSSSSLAVMTSSNITDTNDNSHSNSNSSNNSSSTINNEEEEVPAWFVHYKQQQQSSTSSSSSSSSSSLVYFNTQDGEGICGGITAPAYTWFTAINSTIQPPANHPPELRIHPFFRSIVSNQIYVLTFLFPGEQAYDSKLLYGYQAKPKVLEPYDLIPRRPPKLNKSKFNMLELSQKFRQQQQQNQFNHQYGSGGSGGYSGGSGGSSYSSQQQQQSYGYQQQQYNMNNKNNNHSYNQQQQQSYGRQSLQNYHHQQPSSSSSSYQQYNNQSQSGRGGRGGGGVGGSSNQPFPQPQQQQQQPPPHQQQQQQQVNYDARYQGGGRGSVDNNRMANTTTTPSSKNYNYRNGNTTNTAVMASTGYHQQQQQQQQPYSLNQPLAFGQQQMPYQYTNQLNHHYPQLIPSSSSSSSFYPNSIPADNNNNNNNNNSSSQQLHHQQQQFPPVISSAVSSIRNRYGYGGIGDVYSANSASAISTATVTTASATPSMFSSQPIIQDPYGYTQLQPQQQQQPLQQQQQSVYMNPKQYQPPQHQVQPLHHQPQQQQQQLRIQPQTIGQTYNGRNINTNSSNSNSYSNNNMMGGSSGITSTTTTRPSFSFLQPSSQQHQQHQGSSGSGINSTVRSLEDMRKNLSQQYSNATQRK